MSVDEEGSSVSLEETEGTASNSLENVRTVASSNTSLNHSNVSKDLFLQIAWNYREQRIMVASHAFLTLIDQHHNNSGRFLIRTTVSYLSVTKKGNFVLKISVLMNDLKGQLRMLSSFPKPLSDLTFCINLVWEIRFFIREFWNGMTVATMLDASVYVTSVIAFSALSVVPIMFCFHTFIGLIQRVRIWGRGKVWRFFKETYLLQVKICTALTRKD